MQRQAIPFAPSLTLALALFLALVGLGAAGCREEAQEKWLARHQNVPTAEEVERALPARQPPAGPAMPKPPEPKAAAAGALRATDDALAQRIRQSLAREPYLRDKMALVDVSVRHGQARLTGLVPDEQARDIVRRVSAEVVGEEGVTDLLTVTEH